MEQSRFVPKRTVLSYHLRVSNIPLQNKVSFNSIKPNFAALTRFFTKNPFFRLYVYIIMHILASQRQISELHNYILQNCTTGSTLLTFFGR